jgi:hypothetical protein
MISWRKSSLRDSGMSIFSSIAHQPLVRLLVLAGVFVADLLVLGVGLDVFDVVRAQPLDRVLVGADRPLHLALENVLVFLFDHAEQIPVAFLRLLVIDQAVMAEPDSSSFITMNGLMHFSCWAWSLTSALEILSWM